MEVGPNQLYQIDSSEGLKRLEERVSSGAGGGCLDARAYRAARTLHVRDTAKMHRALYGYGNHRNLGIPTWVRS